MAANNMLNNAFISDFTGPNKVTKNLWIGGNYSTNPCQRGTTFTGIATATYSLDRMLTTFVSTAVTDVSQATDSPTVAQANIYSANAYKIAVTTADASIAAGDFYTATQRIEGYNFTNIAQRAFTLSFWVKAVKPGIYCVSFVNSGADRSYVAEYTINSASTWEFKTITVSASPSAGTWNYTNGIGLSVNFALACGSTFQTTANAWQTGNYKGTSNQVNGLDSNTNTFQLALVQIESGSVATPFQQLNEMEVLALCQRYYQKTFNQGVTPAQASGTQVGALSYRTAVAGATANGWLWEYPVTMRTNPTVTFYNTNNANTNWFNASLGADSGASSTNNIGDRAFFGTNAQVAGDLVAGLQVIHATLDAEL